MEVLLTDENVVYLVEGKSDGGDSKGNENWRKYVCIKVYHFIAPKVRDLLKFNEIYVNSLKLKDTNI